MKSNLQIYGYGNEEEGCLISKIEGVLCLDCASGFPKEILSRLVREVKKENLLAIFPSSKFDGDSFAAGGVNFKVDSISCDKDESKVEINFSFLIDRHAGSTVDGLNDNLTVLTENIDGTGFLRVGSPYDDDSSDCPDIEAKVEMHHTA